VQGRLRRRLDSARELKPRHFGNRRSRQRHQASGCRVRLLTLWPLRAHLRLVTYGNHTAEVSKPEATFGFLSECAEATEGWWLILMASWRSGSTVRTSLASEPCSK